MLGNGKQQRQLRQTCFNTVPRKERYVWQTVRTNILRLKGEPWIFLLLGKIIR